MSKNTDNCVCLSHYMSGTLFTLCEKNPLEKELHKILKLHTMDRCFLVSRGRA